MPFEERNRSNANPATHHSPFFEDSHAVRALAVAYDMTGKREYLDTCRCWSDRMIAYQHKMIPKDAYYLNYYRQPGDMKDQWFSSDAASVGMAVLATAIRATDKAERDRYLDSVKAFARACGRQVHQGRRNKRRHLDTVRWPVVGFHRHLWRNVPVALRGDRRRAIPQDRRRRRPLAAQDRLPRRQADHDERAAVGDRVLRFRVLRRGAEISAGRFPQRKTLLAQISEMLKWLEANQIGRGGKPAWAYNDDSHTDMAGLPLLMYSFASQLPEHRGLTAEADRELRYIDSLILGKDELSLSQLNVWELLSWGMLSYAEKLSPGALFRSSQQSPEKHAAPDTRVNR